MIEVLILVWFPIHVDGIEVTKAGTPDQEGDALGGTINFKLKKLNQGCISIL